MCVYKRNKRRRRLQKTQNQIDCDFGSCTQRRARLAIRFESVLRRWRWREANRDESGFNQIVHTASSSRCCIVFLPGRITKIKRSVDTPVLGILFSHGKRNKVEIGRIGCRSRLLPLPVTTTSDHAIDTTEIGQKWWRSRMIQFLEKSRRRFFLSYFSPFSFLGFPVDAFLFSLLLFLILLLSARWLLSSPANHIRLNLTDSQKKNLKKNKKKRSADHSVRWGKLSGGGFRERKGGITFFFFSFFVFRDSVEWRRYLRCRDQFRSTCPLCPQPLSLSLNVQYT